MEFWFFNLNPEVLQSFAKTSLVWKIIYVPRAKRKNQVKNLDS